jgi:prephenate dehydratase
MRVAFLGPTGTFTEEALRASAPEEVEPVPYPTVHESVMAVQEGAVDRAVVPIENSLEGGVTATLDALATDADRVRIAAEVVRPVHHCLVAAADLDLADVTRVVSHPQATAQCRRFLRERLPGAERVVAPSTADAVRTVAESREPWVALGSRLSAELYDCRVLAEDVEDHPDNLTRFVWLAPAGDAPSPVAGSRAKT